jgi:beta-glucosidase
MKIVSILEGIKAKTGPKTTVYYSKGCELGELALPPVQAQHLIPADGKQGAHGLKAEYFNNQELKGDPALIRIDKEINFDWGSLSPDSTIKADHFSVRWTGKFISPFKGRYKFSITTDDGVRLYIDGKEIVNKWVDRGPTSDYFVLNLEKGRAYELRIEMYENGGGAYASFGWKGEARKTNDIDEAAKIAKKSDAVIFVGGILEGEGRDRADLRLSGQQEELLKAIIKTGVPTVVVLVGGSAITMESWYDDIPAIVDVWYPGEEGGNAVADVLFGDYNPGGKLPITFPQGVGQCPLYYNVKPSGRGYDYVNMSGKPLFAFGHGLSYTAFEYSNLQIQKPEISKWEDLPVTVDVKNTGTLKGDEVVQLYIRDSIASVTRPLLELKAFKRISLEPGEKSTVSFVLKPDDLSFLDENLKKIVEPGKFGVMIGSSSADIRQQGNFTVK